MYSYGFNSGFGFNNPCCGCFSPCGGFPSSGFGGFGGFGSNAAIILVLFILLVIVIGSRFFGPGPVVA